MICESFQCGVPETSGLNLRDATPPNGLVGDAATSPRVKGIERLALGVCVFAALLLLLWVLSRCGHGFEFTDEGFYLNWISSPKDYRASVSQFGFVYHPLYQLVGGDIVLLRQANVLIIFGGAFALCTALLFASVAERVDARSTACLHIVALAFVMAAGSLTFFDLWLPTPGYNSLTFTSLMLAAIGVVLTRRERSNRSLTGWILIGVGGALSFLGKPTSAAVLACAVVVYLLLAGKLWVRGLAVSVVGAGGLLLASALAIDGSPTIFINRILEGLRLGSDLLRDQPLTHMFRLDSFNFSHEQRVNFALLLTVALVATFLGSLKNGTSRLGAALMAMVLAGLSIAISTGALYPRISYAPFQPMQFWAISIAVALSALMSPKRNFASLSRNSIALAVFLIVLPYAYAFGTGNNYWEQGARAGLFWLLGFLVVTIDLTAKNAAWHGLIPITGAALLVPTTVLLVAMENPYRQVHALRLQKTEVQIGRANSTLLLDADGATYVRDLRQILADNGFQAGDPMLDLSGVSPGSIYLIGAHAPGTPWLLAGYPGSNDFFRAALDLAGCQAVAASWILTAPGSANLSFDPLRDRGINITRDYREVGSVHSARGFAPWNFEQHILKPIRNLATAREACEHAKDVSQANDRSLAALIMQRNEKPFYRHAMIVDTSPNRDDKVK
ncbi:hypothetical protein SAMN05443247_04673 [Bradyrhizobium erythrophlei]|nr:hypothetical protein SAMN05443247_04673 [Bradyrhizobium erythrophlei]